MRRRRRSGQLELVSAHNGVEAIRVLAANADVDFAFCDVKMPSMDGSTLLERLRSGHAGVRTVMISTHGDANNRRW